MCVRQRLLAALWVALLVPGPSAWANDAVLKGTARSRRGPEPHAVVWLEVPNAPPPTRAERLVIRQRGLVFNPKLLAVRVGTVVEFPNDDRVFHNVFSFYDGKRFDLGTYPMGTDREVTFSSPGVSAIFCNIHPRMAAYVVAVDTPYFAAAQSDGRFQIAQVPPGTYTYRAWRPSGRVLTGTVVVPATAPLDVRWP